MLLTDFDLFGHPVVVKVIADSNRWKLSGNSLVAKMALRLGLMDR